MFESCRAELSSQKHYDFGLRALKSVLSSAGIIRRDFKASDADLTEGDEEQIVTEAFKGSILPKLLKDDAALLLQVLDRVFVPSSACSQSDAKFFDVVALSCKTLHLSPSPQWMQKLLHIKQLARYEKFCCRARVMFSHLPQYSSRNNVSWIFRHRKVIGI